MVDYIRLYLNLKHLHLSNHTQMVVFCISMYIINLMI